MASTTNDLDYNEVVKHLIVPFDDSEIAERLQNPKKEEHDEYNPRFKYVSPEKYRYRMLAAFPHGYELNVLPQYTLRDKMGITASYEFIGKLPDHDVAYKFTTTVAERYKFPYNTETQTADTTKPPTNYDTIWPVLKSSALKSVAMEMGCGLHLYDKVAVKLSEGKKSITTAAKATTTVKKSTTTAGDGDYSDDFDEEWDGSKEITFGKHKGKTWADVDEGYLTFTCNMTDKESGELKPHPMGVKERARRAAEAGEKVTAASKPKAKSVDPDDEVEEPADPNDFPF